MGVVGIFRAFGAPLQGEFGEITIGVRVHQGSEHRFYPLVLDHFWPDKVKRGVVKLVELHWLQSYWTYMDGLFHFLTFTATISRNFDDFSLRSFKNNHLRMLLERASREGVKPVFFFSGRCETSFFLSLYFPNFEAKILQIFTFWLFLGVSFIAYFVQIRIRMAPRPFFRGF